ncbi:MAG: hypothetical protein K6F32_01100 [Bacilli bacterium]|nr:hypothetical protein [Bacilli bacterium]
MKDEKQQDTNFNLFDALTPNGSSDDPFKPVEGYEKFIEEGTAYLVERDKREFKTEKKRALVSRSAALGVSLILLAAAIVALAIKPGPSFILLFVGALLLFLGCLRKLLFVVRVSPRTPASHPLNEKNTHFYLNDGQLKWQTESNWVWVLTNWSLAIASFGFSVASLILYIFNGEIDFGVWVAMLASFMLCIFLLGTMFSNGMIGYSEFEFELGDEYVTNRDHFHVKHHK